MKRSTKYLLIAAAALIVLGGVIGGLCFAAGVGEARSLADARRVTREFPVSERFTAIEVTSEDVDVRLARAEDGRCRVVYAGNEGSLPEVSVSGGTLRVVSRESRRNWTDGLFSVDRASGITLYLPEAGCASLTLSLKSADAEVPEGLAFGAASVTVTTGDISFSAAVTGTLTLGTTSGDLTAAGAGCGEGRFSVTTGDITLSGLHAAGPLSLSAGTGDITLSGVTAETLTAQTTTGDIDLVSCDAGEISLKTTTGDVTGTLRSGKRFDAQAVTGDVSVPAPDASGGICTVRTTTGDVSLRIG